MNRSSEGVSDFFYGLQIFNTKLPENAFFAKGFVKQNLLRHSFNNAPVTWMTNVKVLKVIIYNTKAERTYFVGVYSFIHLLCCSLRVDLIPLNAARANCSSLDSEASKIMPHRSRAERKRLT